ncbi:replication restart helicase PriA [Entomobacter blattae]|uniref:Replication restart protein PriA n=1 Tax=Entomobacter blattae TaxID=2762277 RepID=A0A7H1NQU3_9PROT|nr:primosomal protein N' [Entomobacter blattae]QNT78153.1 Primosomal protein N' [Entomobacter blattae]
MPTLAPPLATSSPAVTDTNARQKKTVLIALPYPLPGWGFHYSLPQGMALRPGDIVHVPLGKRVETGIVWEEPTHLPAPLRPPAAPPLNPARLRPVIACLPLPPLPQTLRQFIDWVAAYTLSPLGLVLATSLRAMPAKPVMEKANWLWQPLSFTPPTPFSPLANMDKHPLAKTDKPGPFEYSQHHSAYPSFTQPEPSPNLQPAKLSGPSVRITPQRSKILQCLTQAIEEGKTGLSTAELAEQTQTNPTVIKAMSKAGLIKQGAGPAAPLFSPPDLTYNVPTLSEHQAKAAEALSVPIRQNIFCVTLLEGVTGSGKTEVYFQAMAEALAQNRQVLVLLPEIALSAQWISRFQHRFGVTPAVWHSDMTPKQRRKVWQGCITHQAKVVVGARSALFLPFATLGLVVVDEEHETTFKQEEGFSYNARDMAIIRAQLSQAPVILASATPSLETYANIQAGKYRHVLLPNRHGHATTPQIKLLDMRQHPPLRGMFLSPLLTEAMAETMDKNQQVMLFLNRRGYAPLTLCRSCGHRLQCPHCTAWLVAHHNPPRLICHQCDHQEPLPSVCPACGADHNLAPIGPGIERIAEEVHTLFPQKRVTIMASDTLTSPQKTSQIVEQITAGQKDIIIGTQSVAKGWHFPHLTLVGIVDADLSLAGGDLRAGEHTLQLLHQVAGRAGREQVQGHVLIQSYMPEHPVIQALAKGDFTAFLRQESKIRQAGFWPPYGRMIALIITAETEQKAELIALQLAKTAPHHRTDLQILGPSTPVLAILRDQHRRRMLIRAPKTIFLQPIIQHWLSLIPKESQKHIDIDVDPYSFF